MDDFYGKDKETKDDPLKVLRTAPPVGNTDVDKLMEEIESKHKKFLKNVKRRKKNGGGGPTRPK